MPPKKKGRTIFEFVSSLGPSELLVISRARWDKHLRKLVTQEEVSRRMAQEVDFKKAVEEVMEEEPRHGGSYGVGRQAGLEH